MNIALDMPPGAPAHALEPSSADASGTPMTEYEFKRLYDAASGPVLGYLLATTGRRDVAEDLLQETFCRFLAQPRRIHLIEDLLESRRYLFRIATNLLRDRWRKQQDIPFTEPAETGHAPDLDATLHVRAALEHLKPRERELLWLAYVEGMDHREIAAITGLQRLSIRMLLSRARRKAAALLNPNDAKAHA